MTYLSEFIYVAAKLESEFKGPGMQISSRENKSLTTSIIYICNFREMKLWFSEVFWWLRAWPSELHMLYLPKTYWLEPGNFEKIHLCLEPNVQGEINLFKGK